MGDTLRISSEALRRIVAAAAVGDEICGLLLGDPAEARACHNVHPQPARHFEIDPRELLRAHREARASGPAVVGCYHSHPSGDPTPSRADADSAPPDGLVWLIVAGQDARAWRAVADGPVYGRFEPIRLVTT